jgi:hypothetical protein
LKAPRAPRRHRYANRSMIDVVTCVLTRSLRVVGDIAIEDTAEELLHVIAHLVRDRTACVS